MLRVHAALEVCHAALGQLDLGSWHRSCVLLDRMQQDDQVPRALVEHAKVSVAKSHPELAQLALDLGPTLDGMIARGALPAARMPLAAAIVDFCHALMNANEFVYVD